MRYNAFVNNLRCCEYYDIYLLDSIYDLIYSRQLFLYDHTGISVVEVEIQDIVEILQNVIHLLKSYNNYHTKDKQDIIIWLERQLNSLKPLQLQAHNAN